MKAFVVVCGAIYDILIVTFHCVGFFFADFWQLQEFPRKYQQQKFQSICWLCKAAFWTWKRRCVVGTFCWPIIFCQAKEAPAESFAYFLSLSSKSFMIFFTHDLCFPFVCPCEEAEHWGAVHTSCYAHVINAPRKWQVWLCKTWFLISIKVSVWRMREKRYGAKVCKLASSKQ